MENFNDYVKNANDRGDGGRSGNAGGGNGFGGMGGSESGAQQGNLFRMVNDIARKFEGKDQNELLKAIFDEIGRAHV